MIDMFVMIFGCAIGLSHMHAHVHACTHACMHAHTHARTDTHTFYSPLDFVRDYPGELVPER